MSDRYLTAIIHEETMLSPYFGSPLGAVLSPSHPHRGRDADFARGGSRTILLAFASLAG